MFNPYPFTFINVGKHTTWTHTNVERGRKYTTRTVISDKLAYHKEVENNKGTMLIKCTIKMW